MMENVYVSQINNHMLGNRYAKFYKNLSECKPLYKTINRGTLTPYKIFKFCCRQVTLHHALPYRICPVECIVV